MAHRAIIISKYILLNVYTSRTALILNNGFNRGNFRYICVYDVTYNVVAL